MQPVRSFLFPTYNPCSWMSQPRVTSWTPRSHGHPQAFRAFRLHRVIYTNGSTLITQVAYPHLGGQTRSHLLNFQKQQLIPELCEHSMVLAALAEADDGHWNVTDDPIYPTCLEEFRRRHESSQASEANKFAEGSGTGGGSPTCVMTPPSTTSSPPLITPTLGAQEIREIICETLDQVMLSVSRLCKKWVSYGRWIEHLPSLLWWSSSDFSSQWEMTSTLLYGPCMQTLRPPRPNS